MTTNDFIDALEHELRQASRRRVRLALARLPRPPAGAATVILALAVCAAVAVPLLATHSLSTTRHPAARGNGHGPATNPSVPRRVVVGCANTVSGQLGRNWRSGRAGTVVAGPLAWVYLRRNINPMAINRSHFIQALAVVNPGQRTTVTIPARERTRLSLDYTSVQPRSRFRVSQGASSVTFKPCPNPPQLEVAGRFSQFAGGFIVSGPQCAEVDVKPAFNPRIIRRYLPLGRSCPGGGRTPPKQPVRRVLSGVGVGAARFGERPSTVMRRLDALLGQPPSKPYYASADCNFDHAIEWSGLLTYFHRGRFVGYSYQPSRLTGFEPVLATLKGLRVGQTVRQARRLYGTAFGVSPVQGGSWVLSTPTGRLDGYTSDVTNLDGTIMTIEAGHVGCPAMTP